MGLIKSKKRVADHGAVLTPRWLVENMLDLVKGETERIDPFFWSLREAAAISRANPAAQAERR